MKAYKIVRRKDDKFVSLYCDGDIQVEYKINEWSVSKEFLAEKGYHLFIIKDLEDAKSIFNKYCNKDECILFECEVRDTCRADDLIYYKTYYLKDGIFEASYGKTFPNLCRDMAKRVKLIKET